MRPPESIGDIYSRLTQAQNETRGRDQMVMLCNEMYKLKRERKSGFLDSRVNHWRSQIQAEYFEANNRPHNAVNLMTAVLAGNEPQFSATSPGDVTNSAESRAEMFMSGVLRCNSRRQQSDVFWNIVFRTVLDGACGVKVYWDPDPLEPEKVDVVGNPDLDPDQVTAQPWVVMTYDTLSLPIMLDVVPITQLYTMGRGTRGQPFDQVFHVNMRATREVYYEWAHDDDADLSFWEEEDEEDLDTPKHQYVEWWGRDKDGVVWHAVTFQKKWIVEPRPTKYPDIPYVIFNYQEYDKFDKSYKFLPFLYPIFHAANKKEYLTSRSFRLLDLFANLPPVHRGTTPINLEATWGKILNLEPDETIEFPKWPGQPPDVHKYIDDLDVREQEGTFSQAMYGQVSGRMSGYAMSQAIGADTIRSDTPAKNLALGLGKIAEMVFGLMISFAPEAHLAVTAEVGNKRTSVMLAGYETLGLIIMGHIKPKHIADDVRMAGLGAQLASLPNAPVSMKYILEHYFGIAQPELELERKMAEQAENDPIVRLMAILQVLEENGSPYIPVIQQQLQQALQQAGMSAPGQPAPPSPPGMGGPPQAAGQMPGMNPEAAMMGMGMPQALMGNEPPIPPGGNPAQEAGMDRTAMMMGGPPPDMRGM